MDIRRWCFSNRSLTPLFLIAPLLVYAKPKRRSIIVGFALVCAGLLLRIFSVAATGLATRARKVCADSLTTDGPYRYCRNPIYLANLILSSGILFMGRVIWLWPPFFLLFFLQYWAIINLEEEFLEGKFPEEFRKYKEQVPCFWPNLTPSISSADATGHQKIYLQALLNEKSTVITVSSLLAVFLFKKVAE